MSTLQEVSNQLMKSVKEGLVWEYPLSQILETYAVCLLECQEEINYGEAALIVQNSVDVYTKRVDSLDKEVSCLNESFIEHEVQDEKAKNKNKERKSRKTFIDFDNFEPLDFVKEIGKNTYIKHQAQKPVKLLNRRFTQLETTAAQVRFPIEIRDIHSEAIGKKYDFRCNQQLTISGVLVDEAMPNDFNQPTRLPFDQDILDTMNSSQMTNSPPHCSDSFFDDNIQSRINPERAESSLNLPNSTNGNCSQEDLGYFSLSPNDQIPSTINEFSAVNESSQSNESSQNNESCHNNESFSNKDSSKNHYLNSENTSEISGTLNSNDDFCGTVQENSDDFLRNAESNLGLDSIEEIADEPDHFDDGLDDNESERTNQEVSEIINSSEILNGTKEVEVAGNLPEALENDANQSEVVNQPEVNGHSIFDKTTENQDEEEEAAENCKETDSGYRSGESEDYEIPKRSSNRMKNMVCVVNDIDKNIWKPIPFDQGIPEKLPKSRTKFKLPCHISLLKSKSTSRKRKILTESRKSESLPKFLLNESESPMKKMNMYSPSRPFMTLKTEDLVDFQKTFDDCFKSRQCCDVFHYKAATTITMDLLGFFPSFTKHDPLSNSIKSLAPTPEHVSASFSDGGFSPRPASPGIVIFDSNTPPDSPAMVDTFDIEEPLHSTLNYQQMIECRMREIREEFDNRTDLEHGVAQWHRDIKPILQEAERRPPFHIHEYEDRIVEKLEETTERRVSFENIVVEQSPAEVARYFLATLQLANNYNVDIKTNEENTNIEVLLMNGEDTRTEVSYETPKSSKVKKTKRFRHIT